MGEIEKFGGGGDRFDRAFELGDIGVARAEVGKEGDEVGHTLGRLAPRKKREKRKQREKGSWHDYFLAGGESGELISSQNLGFSARSSS